MHSKGIVVTDFDGTIYSDGSGFHEQDLATLRSLGEEGYVRVIATGRSMQSLFRVIDAGFPVDYIVFSSGAGVFDLTQGQLLKRTVFSAEETVTICHKLFELKADFMVHHPIPDNHFFHYYQHGGHNPDFFHRKKLYDDYAHEFDWGEVEKLEATQFVIISPSGEEMYRRIEKEIQEVSVIRSSSPLDHRSMWIEIFPAGSHKASGVAWLAERLEIPQERVMAIGNDFNDLHMLEWASTGFVVENAPEELRKNFVVVEPCGMGGFSAAVQMWKGSLQ